MSEKLRIHSDPILTKPPTDHPLNDLEVRQPTDKKQLDKPDLKIVHSINRRVNQKNRISSTEQIILETITMSVKNSGWSPPITDICQATNLSSKASIAHHLDSLKSRGLLRRDPANPQLWLPTSLNLESDPKIGNYRKYPRLNKTTETTNTTYEKRFNRLITKMSPEKVTIFNLILHEYPVTEIRKKTKIAKTIHKNTIEQILLGLVLNPSNKPIENISQTINNIKQLNFTDQIKTIIISTIPQQYPQFLDIHRIYLDKLSTN